MFLFGKSDKEDPTKNMSEREKKDYERNHRNKKSDREWNKLIEMDAMGFFDDEE